MDDRAWIREDTTHYAAGYTTRLMLYNRHTYNDEMVQSNWCNRMAKDAWSCAHCSALPNCMKVDLHSRAGDI